MRWVGFVGLATLLAGCGQGGLEQLQQAGTIPRPPQPYEEGQSTILLDDIALLHYVYYQGVDQQGRPLSKVEFVDNMIEVVDADGRRLTGTDLIGVSFWAEQRPVSVLVPIGSHPLPGPGLKLTVDDVIRPDKEIDRANGPHKVLDPITRRIKVVTETHSYLYKIHYDVFDRIAGVYNPGGNLCDHLPPNLWVDPETSDDHHNYALAFPQIWEYDGWLQNMDGRLTSSTWGGDTKNMTNNPTGFTFACMTGAAAKCARVGYWPGREHVVPATGQHLSPYQMSLYHQACTKVFRADYCTTNSWSYTRDGTAIEIWDHIGIRNAYVPPPSNPPTLPIALPRVLSDEDFFHAIGARYGAATEAYYRSLPPSQYPRDPRFEASWDEWGPACLSRTRWTDLIPDAQCTWDSIEGVPAFGDCHSEAEATAKESWRNSLLFNRSDLNSIRPRLPIGPIVNPGGGVLAATDLTSVTPTPTPTPKPTRPPLAGGLLGLRR